MQVLFWQGVNGCSCTSIIVFCNRISICYKQSLYYFIISKQYLNSIYNLLFLYICFNCLPRSLQELFSVRQWHFCVIFTHYFSYHTRDQHSNYYSNDVFVSCYINSCRKFIDFSIFMSNTPSLLQFKIKIELTFDLGKQFF